MTARKTEKPDNGDPMKDRVFDMIEKGRFGAAILLLVLGQIWSSVSLAGEYKAKVDMLTQRLTFIEEKLDRVLESLHTVETEIHQQIPQPQPPKRRY